jgi:RNA polymerase sigma-70 factor (ECF subfamily)
VRFYQSTILEDQSDKSLLELCLSKDSENYGFNLVVRKYQKQIYWHIRRMVINHSDADDLVQETFVKVWRNMKKFRQESSLYTWIYRIATNETLSFLQRKKLKYMIRPGNLESHLAGKLTDDNFFDGNEVQLRLQKALLSLPGKQRLVFNLKYYSDMTFEEMSVVLDTSVGTLKASHHIAVKKIEKYLINY